MEFKISNKYLELTVSSHGAEKQSIISKETNISYLRDVDKYWNRKAPLLFPIVGKLRDLKTFINNKEYSMNQHGFIRDQEFELYSQTETELVLVNKFNEETLKKYPFEYQVFVKYTLVEKSVYTEFIVKNLDYQVIPFNYGGHPGFKLPLYENETFEDYSVKFEKEENFNAPTVDMTTGTLNFKDTISYKNINEINLNYKYFEIDAIVIPEVKSQSVKLVNKDNKGVKFDFLGFPSLAIWTKPNAPFVCLEPWIGYADHNDSNYQFIEKDNMQFLNPGETFSATYVITVLE
jgi:galactose mutarotase-like enzyme